MICTMYNVQCVKSVSMDEKIKEKISGAEEAALTKRK